jgi:hypothetical protein
MLKQSSESSVSIEDVLIEIRMEHLLNKIRKIYRLFQLTLPNVGVI